MTTCHQEICPHMHFNKCYRQRIRSIPVSIFPDPTIDSFTNVNVKCGKPFKSNIPTVAYEKYIFEHEATNDDRNFVKDFYMENYEKDKMVLNNNIVEQLKEQMYKKSAYILAEGATKDYEEFEEKRKRALNNAKNRAKSAYQAYSAQQKQQKQKNYEENGFWLKKLFRKLQEVAKHIIQGTGQDAGQRQKQFLLSKTNLTANFLAQIKIRNPKNAYDILEELRVLMQKKKLKFSDQRQEQECTQFLKVVNKSVTQSFASETSQNTSQNSMLSQATSLNESNVFGQDKVVEQFWDFEQLKKKWKLEDVEAVRDMIRRVLTKKVVFDAELQAVKQRKQAQKLNEELSKMNAKNSSKTIEKTKNQTTTKKTPGQKSKAVQTVIEKKLAQPKIQLSKQQEAAKLKIVEGGRFDAIGQKFMRNKTYSQIFKNKQNQIKPVFVENEEVRKSLNASKDDKLFASTNYRD